VQIECTVPIECTIPNECTVPIASRFPQEHCCLEGYRLRPFDLLVRETCSWRWVRSVVAMIVTGRNRSREKEGGDGEGFSERHYIDCYSNACMSNQKSLLLWRLSGNARLSLWWRFAGSKTTCWEAKVRWPRCTVWRVQHREQLKHSENCTFECSGLKRMRCVILPYVACPAEQYFSTLTLKRHDFRKKKLLTIKCLFWFSLQLLSEIFLVVRRIQRDIVINVHIAVFM